MCDGNLNLLNLKDWDNYQQEESYSKFKMVINEYYVKYKGFFNKNWENTFNRDSIKESLA